MSNRFSPIQPRWVIYGILFIVVVAGLALAQTPPDEFVELDNKLKTGGCALWNTFLTIVKLVLFFGAGYAAISYFIGNANSAMKAAIYVLVGGAVFVVLIAVIRYVMGGPDPCAITTDTLEFKMAQWTADALKHMA